MYHRDIILSTGNDKIKTWKQKLPLKTLSEEKDGLIVVLEKDKAVDYEVTCQKLSFVVHPVDEVPTNFEDIELCEIRHGMVLDILMIPEVLMNDEDLRSFPINERQCLMEGERKLKFFKKYSVRNCEMECLSTFTFEKCSCVPFYVLRNSTMAICGFLQFDCYNNAELEIKLGQDSEYETVRNCNCLPTCNTINYKLEYLYNDLKLVSNDTEEFNTVTINFRFKNEEFLPKRRFRNLNFSGFLAETAGLHGLYCGFSILTFVELFYYFAMRPATNMIRRYRCSKN